MNERYSVTRVMSNYRTAVAKITTLEESQLRACINYELQRPGGVRKDLMRRLYTRYAKVRGHRELRLVLQGRIKKV